MEKNVTEVFEPSAPRDDTAIEEFRDGGACEENPGQTSRFLFSVEGSWKGK
jgi:hypothetical protein